ncbi:hypothetical protein R3P38DRAFT_3037589 [Favolaschia claudopus]|uniref:Uncharacterized protein n=1 Tax=Favolaschia claudopus TaxID=2862362 RepID=A0AAW0AB75_9AGAR
MSNILIRRNFAGWPGVVIFAQLSLWTITALVVMLLCKRGGLAFPHWLGVFAQEQPHFVELMTAQMATVMALWSTSVYAWATSVSSMFNIKKQWWLVICIVSITGQQIWAWTKFLEPRTIALMYPLVGNELDLSAPLWQQLNYDPTVGSCIQSSMKSGTSRMGWMASGSAAVADELSGFPTSFKLFGHLIQGSTGGALPLSLNPTESRLWFPNDHFPDMDMSGLSGGINPPPNLRWRYHSIDQQGFTAEVSCEFQGAPDDEQRQRSALRSVTLTKQWESETHSADMDAENITFTSFVPQSTGAKESDPVWTNWIGAYTHGKGSNYLLVNVAPSPSNDSYTLTLHTSETARIYRFLRTTVCTLKPKIPRVKVLYQPEWASNSVRSTRWRPGAPAVDADIHGAPMLAAAHALSQMVVFSQGLSTNGVGDQLKSLVATLDPTLSDESVILRVVEEYIRGVVEYSGTVLRACLTGHEHRLLARQQAAAAHIDNESHHNEHTLRTPYTGQFETHNLGWIWPSSLLNIFWYLCSSIHLGSMTLFAAITEVLDRAWARDSEEEEDGNEPVETEAVAATGIMLDNDGDMRYRNRNTQ